MNAYQTKMPAYSSIYRCFSKYHDIHDPCYEYQYCLSNMHSYFHFLQLVHRELHLCCVVLLLPSLMSRLPAPLYSSYPLVLTMTCHGFIEMPQIGILKSCKNQDQDEKSNCWCQSNGDKDEWSVRLMLPKLKGHAFSLVDAAPLLSTKVFTGQQLGRYTPQRVLQSLVYY